MRTFLLLASLTLGKKSGFATSLQIDVESYGARPAGPPKPGKTLVKHARLGAERMLQHIDMERFPVVEVRPLERLVRAQAPAALFAANQLFQYDRAGLTAVI